VLSKSAAIALPIAFPIIDLIAATAAAERTDQPLTRHFHIGVTIIRLVPSALLAIGMLAVTKLANVEGEDELADAIAIPQGLPRILKACMVVSIYMLKAVWPVGLRPHYKVDLRDLQLDMFVTGNVGDYTAAPNTDAATGGVGADSVLGPPAAGISALCAVVWVAGFTVVLGADALCYLADSALAEEGNDDSMMLLVEAGGGGGGDGVNTARAAGAFLAHRHSQLTLRQRGRRAPSLEHGPFSRASSTTASDSSISHAVSSVALLGGWVYYCAMFVPTCGIVQHGMVSMGADR
jgi:hypothetical protein